MPVPLQHLFLKFSHFITIWFFNKYLLLSIFRWLKFFSYFFFLLFLLFLIFSSHQLFLYLFSLHISSHLILLFLIDSYFLLISIFLIFSCLFLFPLLLWFIIYFYFLQWTSTPKQFRIELLSFRGPAFSKRYVRTFPILLIAII